MDLGLNGKVAIVTGGSRGIGRIITHAFAKEGARVVIASTNKDRGEQGAREVKAMGGETIMIRTDVSLLEETEHLVQDTIERFGKVDILIHNAAAYIYRSFLETPLEEWDRILGVCLMGAFNCCRSVLPFMTHQKWGRIIFIGSDAERKGDSHQTIYASAKGSIIAFAKSLAQDVGPKGITVNVVSPALVLTADNKEFYTRIFGLDDEKKVQRLYSLYPLRRLGKPEDIADMAAFLASEKAGFITGQTICVNGGFSMVS